MTIIIEEIMIMPTKLSKLLFIEQIDLKFVVYSKIYITTTKLKY